MKTNTILKPRESTAALYETIHDILEEQKSPLTVRQIFYKLVAMERIPLTVNGRSQVERHIQIMRDKELIPHSWISDNPYSRTGTVTHRPYSDMLGQRNINGTNVKFNKEFYVGIWVSKVNMAGVVYPIAEKYNIPVFVPRG
jgi:hypothetical protein